MVGFSGLNSIEILVCRVQLRRCLESYHTPTYKSILPAQAYQAHLVPLETVAFLGEWLWR